MVNKDNEGQKDKENSQIIQPFLVKGDSLVIPNLTISIRSDGKLEAQPVVFHTGSYTCPYWLQIAYDHLLMTEKNSNAITDAQERNNNEEIGDALKLEFSSGMQAMMAAGIAVDAFYASTKDYVAIPDETVRAWRNNRTARYKQVSEVLRLAYRIDNSDIQEFRRAVKHIYHLRDRAVHPSSGALPLALHPQLNKMTNWRYAAFCFQKAKVIVSFSLQIVYRLIASSREEDYASPELMNHCKILLVSVRPLLDMWEGQYGSLIDQAV